MLYIDGDIRDGCMFLNEEVRSLRWKTPSTIRMMEALENLHLIEPWALWL